MAEIGQRLIINNILKIKPGLSIIKNIPKSDVESFRLYLGTRL
jgi:hypothetical protein